MSVSQINLSKILLLSVFFLTAPAAIAMESDDECYESVIEAPHTYVQLTLSPDVESRKTMSRLVSSGAKEDLYDEANSTCQLSLPFAVWKVNQQSPHGLISHLEKNAALMSGSAAFRSRIKEFGFLPGDSIDLVHSDYIVACFEDSEEFQKENKAAFNVFKGMKSKGGKGDLAVQNASLLPQFGKSNYKLFMTVVQSNRTAEEKDQLLKTLNDNLKDIQKDEPLVIRFGKKQVKQFDPRSSDYMNVLSSF